MEELDAASAFDKDPLELTAEDVYDISYIIGRHLMQLGGAEGRGTFAELQYKIIRVLEMLECLARRQQQGRVEVLTVEGGRLRTERDRLSGEPQQAAGGPEQSSGPAGPDTPHQPAGGPKHSNGPNSPAGLDTPHQPAGGPKHSNGPDSPAGLDTPHQAAGGPEQSNGPAGPDTPHQAAGGPKKSNGPTGPDTPHQAAGGPKHSSGPAGPDTPRFTLQELRDVLQERNKLKAQLHVAQEELECYRNGLIMATKQSPPGQTNESGPSAGSEQTRIKKLFSPRHRKDP